MLESLQLDSWTVRCFEEENVVHVEGRVDPLDDIQVIDTELVLADLESVERQIPKLEKKVRGGDKESAEQLALLKEAYQLLDDGRPVRAGQWNADQVKGLKMSGLITYKPVLYVCNVNEEGAAAGNHFSAKVAELAATENSNQ